MKIEKITRLDLRIFKNFSWPKELTHFKSKNLIYGWNGSGKSTLADIFHTLERRKNLEEGSFTLQMKDGSVLNSTKIQSSLSLPSVRIFNRTYVEENVFTSDGTAKPIVYLGKESIEEQEKIGNLAKEVEKLQSEIAKDKNKEDKAKEDLDKFCSDKAKNIKEHLRSSDENKYNNYNKSDFKNKADSLSNSSEDITSKILEGADFNRLKSRIQETSKEKVDNLTSPEVGLDTLFSKAKELLSNTVTSHTLEELKDNYDLSEWIKVGLKIHKVESGYKKNCAFCEGELCEKRLRDIENHFNENFKKFESEISILLSNVEETIASLSNIAHPDEIKFYSDIKESYKDYRDSHKESINNTVAWLKSLKIELEIKQGKPFAAMQINVKSSDVSVSTDDINSVIKQHNETTDKFEEETNNARHRLEEHFVASVLEDYKNKQSSISSLENSIEEKKVVIGEKSNEKSELEKSIENSTQAADDLNKDLAHFLGRDEIKFQNESGGYIITRNDCPAKNLSEGEKTALAFLHFLKSLSDKNFKLKSGIVVIDDPISSLDSNSIYSAFSFMQDRIQKADQLFIMTHNFSLFKEVRRWFVDKKNKQDSALYMLKSDPDREERAAIISELDHLLRDFNSEYHFLFSMVYKSQAEKSLFKLYPISNITRKLLEEFLSFKIPTSANFRAKLNEISLDTEINNKIIRFTDSHSHTDKIGDTEDLSLFQELPSVVRNIMELIENADETHFKKMESLVRGEQ